MNAQRKLSQLLQTSGAVLKRSHKHHIYQLPNGRILVLSKTGSDHRHIKNALSDLRKVMRGGAR